MAVYELNGGQLLRVARSVDGKLEQQYFSLLGINRTKQRATRIACTQRLGRVGCVLGLYGTRKGRQMMHPGTTRIGKLLHAIF